VQRLLGKQLCFVFRNFPLSAISEGTATYSA